jgi:Methylenetetrahydrofolate reductase
MFFDTAVYQQFVTDCRKVGITCPIVPGIMCLNAYAGFRKMSQFCKSRVPPSLESSMQELQSADDNTFKQFGMDYGATMCRELIAFGVPALHFYTLNLEKVVYGILERIGYLESKTKNTTVPDDGDASIMQAVGSAWARVGDTVTSIFGRGTVMELRSSGAAMIRIESWELAGGQHPTAYLEKEHYEKVF